MFLQLQAAGGPVLKDIGAPYAVKLGLQSFIPAPYPSHYLMWVTAVCWGAWCVRATPADGCCRRLLAADCRHGGLSGPGPQWHLSVPTAVVGCCLNYSKKGSCHTEMGVDDRHCYRETIFLSSFKPPG